MDLVEEKNQLNLVVDSKNAMIGKLQKQIYEVFTILFTIWLTRMFIYDLFK